MSVTSFLLTCFLHSKVYFYLRINLLVSKYIIVKLNQILLIKLCVCTFLSSVSHEGGKL